MCRVHPFNLYIVDLDRELAKKNIRGITLGGERKKLQSLAYANDIVLLAKNKVTLENMMNTLKGFGGKKKMLDKTKVLISNSSGKSSREK